MNSISKKLTSVLFVLAAVCIVAGIILFAFLVPHSVREWSGFFTVCMVTMAIVLLLIGVGILYLLYTSRDTEPNFFLYDTKTTRNIELEELTFDRVNSRMSYFMSTLTTSQERLWSDNVLTVNPARFGVNEIYRPLSAYKMLFDLSEIDRPEGWRLFLCASPATIDALLSALKTAGEDDMLTKLRYAYDNAADRDDIEWLRDYVKKNSTYISHRMMGYVRKNIEWFY